MVAVMQNLIYLMHLSLLKRDFQSLWLTVASGKEMTPSGIRFDPLQKLHHWHYWNINLHINISAIKFDYNL